MTDTKKRTRADRRRAGRAADGRWTLRPDINPRTARANANRARWGAKRA